MASPLLFGKRRNIAADAAAQYVGTDSELDVKVPGPLLFGKYVGTDTEIDEKAPKG